MQKTRVIQICGDPTVDWMAIRKETEPGLGPFFWMPDQPAPKVGLSVQPGGSALITQFLQALIPPAMASVQGITLDAELLEKPEAPITRAWTIWQQQGNGNARSSRGVEQLRALHLGLRGSQGQRDSGFACD